MIADISCDVVRTYRRVAATPLEISVVPCGEWWLKEGIRDRLYKALLWFVTEGSVRDPDHHTVAAGYADCFLVLCRQSWKGSIEVAGHAS